MFVDFGISLLRRGMVLRTRGIYCSVAIQNKQSFKERFKERCVALLDLKIFSGSLRVHVPSLVSDMYGPLRGFILTLNLVSGSASNICRTEEKQWVGRAKKSACKFTATIKGVYLIVDGVYKVSDIQRSSANSGKNCVCERGG